MNRADLDKKLSSTTLLGFNPAEGEDRKTSEWTVNKDETIKKDDTTIKDNCWK